MHYLIHRAIQIVLDYSGYILAICIFLRIIEYLILNLRKEKNLLTEDKRCFKQWMDEYSRTLTPEEAHILDNTMKRLRKDKPTLEGRK